MNKSFLDFIDKNKILIVSFAILASIVVFFALQKVNPDSLDGMLTTGDKYEKSGKLATAFVYYNKAVRAYPGCYEAHIKLGRLFRQINEINKAKLEFYRAIKLSNTGKYDAYFDMADIYVEEGEYELAQDLLMQIQYVPQKNVSDKIGDFYLIWGNSCKYSNLPEAIRRYKLAYDFYSRSDKIKAMLASKILENSYSDLADSLIASKKVDDAIHLLNSSINYFDNATAHYKLARIYKKTNIEKAIQEFSIAFSLNNSIAPTDEFVQLLTKKADNLYKSGDKLTAKIYYEKANKLNSSVKIPNINSNQLIVNLIASKYSRSENSLYCIPGISFKITNISKNKIPYIKVKAVFYLKGTKYSENAKVITTNEAPLPPYSITSAINIYSPKSIYYNYDKSMVEVYIYISQQHPDKWKLYRSTYFDISK